MMENWGDQGFTHGEPNESNGQQPQAEQAQSGGLETRAEDHAAEPNAYWQNGAGSPEHDRHENASAGGDREGNGILAEESAAASASGPSQEMARLELPRGEPVPDFETAASECFNRALFIALSLGHTCLSSHHLMLALTMDPSARKYLERIGDIDQLRERAMYKLGKMNTKFQQGGIDLPQRFPPSPTSDFDAIRKAAAEAADDRGQRVAITDVINAFPHRDGRLTYGHDDELEAMPALMEKIKSDLVPRMADFMAEFERSVRETLDRQLAAALQDFSERQLPEALERQLPQALERQFAAQRENDIETQGALQARLDALFQDFSERLGERIEETRAAPANGSDGGRYAGPAASPTGVPTTNAGAPEPSPRKRSYWGLSILA